MIQQRTREGIAARQREENYHHGRPPLGFQKEDGQLLEGENYDQVLTVLDVVQKGEMSKRQAARKLRTSRPTVAGRSDERSCTGFEPVKTPL